MSWLSDFNERWAPDVAESASRRGWLLWFGVVVLVAGLLAAGFLWSAGNDRRRNAIEGFARAPVACDTTLDFAETGEYLVFIESAGRLNGLRGDCDVEGTYDLGSVTPAVEITVVDPDGAPVKLNPAVGGPNYSEAGFVGAAAFTIEIVETDDHVVRVESTDNEVFVIAVGRDPSEGVGLLRGAAAALAIAGLLLGGGLILLSLRRPATEVAAPPWTSGAVSQQPQFAPGQSPQGPPTFGHLAGPPQYPRAASGQLGQYAQPELSQYGRPQLSEPQPPQKLSEPVSIAGQPALPGQPGWGHPSPPPPPPPPPPPTDLRSYHQPLGSNPDESGPEGPENAAPTDEKGTSGGSFPAPLNDQYTSGRASPEDRSPPQPPPAI